MIMLTCILVTLANRNGALSGIRSSPTIGTSFGMRLSVLKWTVLEGGLTKPLALALEAFHASHAIAAEPDAARGGPWSRPTLTREMRKEAQLVSRMTLAAMLAFAADNPDGPLGHHLADLSYDRAKKAAAESIARGVTVKRKKKSGSSGCTGSQSRKAQVKRGTLKRPSAYYKRLHRGPEPEATRKRETAQRPSRRQPLED